MSAILNDNDSSNMGTPFFHEFKRQASSFFKEKFKTARLALTDVTPAQLMTEEATNGNTWAPDAPTLRSISRAAFELDDYLRIVEILHKRLLKFEKNNWRVSYNSLIVLEQLLTHGPESVAKEFQCDKDVIDQMQSFQYIDDRGFNWGLTVRKKSEWLLKLLNDGRLLKEERDRARKLSREIRGFGSFYQRSTPAAQGILRETSSSAAFGRSNSVYNNHENEENQIYFYSDNGSNKKAMKWSSSHQGGIKEEHTNYRDDSQKTEMLRKSETSLIENMAPDREESHQWNAADTGESNPLLEISTEDSRQGIFIEDEHPFNSTENQTSASLLSAC